VRTVRALEVLRLSARSISEAHAEHRFADRPFELVWLGLAVERDRLVERLRTRVESMFAQGLVAELAGLHAAGFAPDLRPFRAIGYREAGLLLAGEIDQAEAIERAWIATRRYAKRQRTWFRAEPELDWVDADDPKRARERVLAALSRR
jgi:tRNA dimethylallyltransferase